MPDTSILNDSSLEFLEKYLNNAAPTGYEWDGQKLWMNYLKPYVDEFITDARDFLEKHPVSYLVVRDAEGSSPGAYEIKGMPTAFLIDREGVIRHVHEGFNKSDKERVRALVADLLKE